MKKITVKSNGKENKFYYKKHKVELYGWDIYFVYATSLNAARGHKIFTDILGNPSGSRDAFAYCATRDSILTCVIFLPMMEDGRTCSLSTMAHECFHAAYSVLDFSGVKDEEATAYLLGSLCEQADMLSMNVFAKENGREIHKKRVDIPHAE